MIILTRPNASNLRLMAQLSVDDVLNLPALELVPLSFSIPDDIGRYKLIFFSSGFAASTFFAQLQKSRAPLAADALLLAVGRSTAQTLRACLDQQQSPGTQRIVTPDTYGADSSALIETYRQQLAKPLPMQQAKPPALIVRSHSGRQELPDFLTAQGHAVDYLPVYERRAAEWSEDMLLRLAGDTISDSRIWLITSNQGVDSIIANLLRRQGLINLIRKDRFVVLHKRIADHLQKGQAAISAEKIVICQPEEVAILDTLESMHQSVCSESSGIKT